MEEELAATEGVGVALEATTSVVAAGVGVAEAVDVVEAATAADGVTEGVTVVELAVEVTASTSTVIDA